MITDQLTVRDNAGHLLCTCQTKPAIAMLTDVLLRLTVDQLKSLMRWLPDATPTGKKEQLIGQILKSLDGDGLRALWDRLDDTQRMAVAEAAYAERGVFDRKRFRAKYGRLPDFTVDEGGRSYSYRGQPTALGLFLYYEAGRYSLPFELGERLRGFVHEPAPIRLSPVDALPEKIGEKQLTVRRTELDAVVDLPVFLRLADQGKIQTSEKTSLPGSATLRLLTEHLANGDFYGPAGGNPDPEIGPLKAFSWPLLLQAAGLVQRNGSKLALSIAGRRALTSAPAIVLRAIWNKWLKTNLFDEFSRIDVIKGQRSKARAMTAVAPRRTVISDVLRGCPIGAWVGVDNLSRFMEATGRTFEVANDPWSLYLCDPEYGSLGHDGYHDWSILQLRYLLCMLFEYAAALGVVDVAYIEPAGVRDDYRGMWGTDNLEYLSRYDGLMYFRVSPLGAYCLGLSDEYAPPPIVPSVKLAVLPSLQMNVVDGRLSIDEMLTLATWAEELAENWWRLDLQRAVGAIEKGLDIGELRVFLEAREDQPLPETVESFLKAAERQGKALKVLGTVLLIDCENEKIASMVADAKEATGLCLRAGERQLVVKLEHEEKFRSLVRKLGFGVTGPIRNSVGEAG